MNPPKARLYKQEYAQELLRIAQSDFQSGSILQKARAGRAENLAYFAEQVVEKALKAYLCHKLVPFPATHDIRQLLSLMESHGTPPHGDNLGELTIYGTVRRYEEGPWSLAWEEADLAFAAAKDVLDWVEAAVKV